MLCYNFGVECFQGKTFEAAVTWLKNSFEMGKRNNAVSHKNQVFVVFCRVVGSLHNFTIAK